MILYIQIVYVYDINANSNKKLFKLELCRVELNDAKRNYLERKSPERNLRGELSRRNYSPTIYIGISCNEKFNYPIVSRKVSTLLSLFSYGKVGMW